VCHEIGRFLSADKSWPRKVGRCRPTFIVRLHWPLGAPIPNFGGGGVLKNPAAAARPARRRALLRGSDISVMKLI